MARCRNCEADITLDANGAGGYVWVHDFGGPAYRSTVCHDDPPGSIGDIDGLRDEDLTVAEPACEYPERCSAEPGWYIMGAHAGDWAVRVCDGHRDWAHRALVPYIEYPERRPAPESSEAVRSTTEVDDD
jgi:hypothetical protein